MVYKGLYGRQAIAFTAYNQEMWTCGLQEGDSVWKKVSYSGNTLDYKGELATWDGWRNLPVGMYKFVSGIIPYTTGGPNVKRDVWDEEYSKERNWSSLLITEGITGKNAIALSVDNRETWTCTVNGSVERWERLTKARDTLAFRGTLTTWPEAWSLLPIGTYGISDSMPSAPNMPPQLDEEYGGYASAMVVRATYGVDVYLTSLSGRELWLRSEREGDGVWRRILPANIVGGTNYQSASAWAKVAEVKVPTSFFGRQSVTFLVTSENTTSTAAERYAGILELNVHETPASAVLRWLVVSGFGLSNFNLRHEGDMLTLWVLPTIRGISFTLIGSTSAGNERDNVKLFYRTEGATRTGTSLGNSEKANIQDIADILSGATSTAAELRIGNRVIKQVNPGVEPTDAANVAQLLAAASGIYWQGNTSEWLSDRVTALLGQPLNSPRTEYAENGIDLCSVYELTVNAYDDTKPYQGKTLIYVPNDTTKRIEFYMVLATGTNESLLVDWSTDLTEVIPDAIAFGYQVLLKLVATNQLKQHSFS